MGEGERRMKVTENPFIALVEECILLRDNAQRILSVALGGDRLSRLEGLVLLSLAEAESELSASQLARNLGHPRQVIQRVVNRLEHLGLVCKKSNPHHKTSPIIVPTEAGRDFEGEAGRALLATIGSVMGEQDMRSCESIVVELRRLNTIVCNLEVSGKDGAE